MKELKLKTDNLKWAICIAGAIKSAYGHKVNDKISFAIESSKPEIKLLGEYFNPVEPSMQEIDLPTSEEEFIKLDKLAKKRMDAEIRDFHGIPIQDTTEPRLPIINIASQLLLFRHDIFSVPALFYPEVKSNYDFNIFLGRDEYEKFATTWSEGYGIKPNIFVSSGDVYEDIKVINNPFIKLVILDADDPLLFVLKAYYKGFERLIESPQILAMYDEGFMPTRFTLSPWAACQALLNNPEMNLNHDGKVRNVQELCNFDSHKFAKMVASGEFKNE